MEEMIGKKSYIIGHAQVVFGGGIALVGTLRDDGSTLNIGLAELCNPEAVDLGMELDENVKTYGTQVDLVFPDLHSLQNFRNVLNELEQILKERTAKQKEE